MCGFPFTFHHPNFRHNTRFYHHTHDRHSCTRSRALATLQGLALSTRWVSLTLTSVSTYNKKFPESPALTYEHVLSCTDSSPATPPSLPCSIPSRHGPVRPPAPARPLLPRPIFHLPRRNVRNVCSIAFLPSLLMSTGVPCSSDEISPRASASTLAFPEILCLSLPLRFRTNERTQRTKEGMNVDYLSRSPFVRLGPSAFPLPPSSRHICQPPPRRTTPHPTPSASLPSDALSFPGIGGRCSLSPSLSLSCSFPLWVGRAGFSSTSPPPDSISRLHYSSVITREGQNGCGAFHLSARDEMSSW